MKREIDDFEKRSQSQLASQGNQISAIMSNMKLNERGLQNSMTEMLTNMKTVTSARPRKMIIEEEIVEENSGPRILYPSNSQGSYKTPMKSTSQTQASPPSPPSQGNETRGIQSTNEREIQQEAPHSIQSNPENVNYEYNLIIDERGTRWMPIPENGKGQESQSTATATSTRPVAVLEKYPLKEKNTKRSRGIETIPDLLTPDGGEDPHNSPSSQIFIEKKAIPITQKSKKSSEIKKENNFPPERGHISSTTELKAWEDRYQEIPLRRGVVPNNGEMINWNEDRYIAPYISRVKIHARNGEKAVEEEEMAEGGQEGQEEESMSSSTNQKNDEIIPSSIGPPETQQQLIQLLGLLVSTQQQTLQGHNELMLRLLQQSTSVDRAPFNISTIPREATQHPPVITTRNLSFDNRLNKAALKYQEEDMEESNKEDPLEITSQDKGEEEEEYSEHTVEELTVHSDEPKQEIPHIPEFQRVYKTSFGCLLGEGWNYGLARQSQLEYSMNERKRIENEEIQDEDEEKEEEMEEEKEEEKEETKNRNVSKLLWEMARGDEGNQLVGGAAAAAGSGGGGTVERIHRIPDYHTVETLNHLQNKPSHEMETINSSHPIATVAQVMIHALQQMVEGSSSHAPPPLHHHSHPAPPPPPLLSSSSRRPSQRNYSKSNPTYPLVHPSRYWTDGQDTIGPFNTSGIYGPRNYHPPSSSSDQQITRGSHQIPRERWQNEYGVHDVYPYYENKIPQRQSRTPPPPPHSSANQRVQSQSRSLIPKNRKNEENNSNIVTENLILEDMKESKLNQRTLQDTHQKKSHYFYDQDDDNEGEEEDSRDEELIPRDQLTHLSSDGSLEELSAKPLTSKSRQTSQRESKRREKSPQIHDSISLFPLPRPLYSNQLQNTATKEIVDWDMSSLLDEDGEESPYASYSRHSRHSSHSHHHQISQQHEKMKKNRVKSHEMLTMKPLQSERRADQRKNLLNLIAAPYDDEMDSVHEPSHKRENLTENWYLSNSLESSSDQSLTSASYSSNNRIEERQYRNDLHYLHPTPSDYEPSTPTLSIASNSSSDRRIFTKNTKNKHKPVVETLSSNSSNEQLFPHSSPRSSSSSSNQTLPSSTHSTSSSSSSSQLSQSQLHSSDDDSDDQQGNVNGKDGNVSESDSDLSSSFIKKSSIDSSDYDSDQYDTSKHTNIAQNILQSISKKNEQKKIQNGQTILDRNKVRLWKPTMMSGLHNPSSSGRRKKEPSAGG